MQPGQLFFNTCEVESPDVIFAVGSVGVLDHEIEPNYWEAKFDSKIVVVSPEHGIAVDKENINVNLFRRAVALGYRGDPAYFLPGFNKLLEYKLDVSEKEYGFIMSVDDAIDKARQYDSDLLGGKNIGDPRLVNCITDLRDGVIVYAERLEELAQLVKRYIQEQPYPQGPRG